MHVHLCVGMSVNRCVPMEARGQPQVPFFERSLPYFWRAGLSLGPGT